MPSNRKVDSFLAHYGILGQKWGVRRYQNKDGSLTELGKKRLEQYKAEVSEPYKKMLGSAKAHERRERSYKRLYDRTAGDGPIDAKLNRELQKIAWKASDQMSTASVERTRAEHNLEKISQMSYGDMMNELRADKKNAVDSFLSSINPLSLELTMLTDYEPTYRDSQKARETARIGEGTELKLLGESLDKSSEQWRKRYNKHRMWQDYTKEDWNYQDEEWMKKHGARYPGRPK